MTTYQYSRDPSRRKLRMDKYKLTRPAEFAETRIIDSILDGTFPVGFSLPAEREFAESLGITRPTLREALQRLARDGWLEIRHGKPTRVCDFWREGSLGVLEAISRRAWAAPPNFVSNLLDVRLALAPAYTRLAVQNHSRDAANLAQQGMELFKAETDPDRIDAIVVAFARFDWRLHHELTILSENPVYTLILNGFSSLYIPLAQHYFHRIESQRASLAFYADLAAAAASADPQAAEKAARQAMAESCRLWKISSLRAEE